MTLARNTNFPRVLVALTASFLLALPGLSVAQNTAQVMSPELRNAGYLAANCANCHGTSGRNAGSLPSLAGLPAAGIAQAMRDYRDGKRKATIMHQLSKGYTDAQIDAMAAYFAAQPATK
jgi:cytochrome subunit of sulfide dehydrogenase